MKLVHRLISLMLIVCITLGSAGLTVLAESVLRLPAALKIIEEEAFYGSTSVDKVVLHL